MYVPPLFQAYPRLASHLPRHALLDSPTPVHRLDKLGAPSLWIKRDDATSRVLGGAKVRKLEFLLGAAIAQRRSRLLVLGTLGSHMTLAAAVFANKLDLACDVIVCDQPPNHDARNNLLALKQHSAGLTHGRGQVPAALRFFGRAFLEQRGSFAIPPGGSNPIGTLGMVNAAFELKEQIAQGVVPRPGVIVCALGSGGTLAGLALGVQLAQLNIEVVGVRTFPAYVSGFPVCTAGRVRRLMHRTHAILRRADPSISTPRLRRPRIIAGYMGDGYAMPTEAARHAQRLLADTHGLYSELTYTAKALAYAIDLCADSGNGSPVLYWHTCGREPERPVTIDYRELPRSLHGMFRTE